MNMNSKMYYFGAVS